MKENLEIKVEENGIVWLTFNASTGRSATLNVCALANRLGPITAQALEDWCADRRRD